MKRQIRVSREHLQGIAGIPIEFEKLNEAANPIGWAKAGKDAPRQPVLDVARMPVCARNRFDDAAG